MGAHKQSRLAKSIPGSSDKLQTRGGGGSEFSIEWVKYTFSPEEKARIRDWQFDSDRILDRIAYMVESGHKLTVSPENSNGFVGVSVFGWTSECSNKGYGVSGEGGTFHAALKSLYWKLELLDGDLRTPPMDGDDDFR